MDQNTPTDLELLEQPCVSLPVVPRPFMVEIGADVPAIRLMQALSRSGLTLTQDVHTGALKISLSEHAPIPRIEGQRSC